MLRPDPAAITQTSATTQLPPGYHLQLGNITGTGGSGSKLGFSMREEALRLAGPAYTSRKQPAAGNTAAVELCTLLLTDQEAEAVE
ncbi:hypothetical protein HaLaN_17939 [Haematococcus lacustris]|uniref:Uncharacterized protein n=1 Tax=Haematococcus lacustris TaxID=44745 RepID=A0A699ZFS3_HAELA|nr:hypothetical protein HaLaN_17939 [Haematococcus lacustris]